MSHRCLLGQHYFHCPGSRRLSGGWAHLLINLGTAKAWTRPQSSAHQTTPRMMGLSPHTTSGARVVSQSSCHVETFQGQGTGPNSDLNQDPSLHDKEIPGFCFFLMRPKIHRTLSNIRCITEHPLRLSVALLTNFSTHTKLSHTISCL